MDWFNKLLLYGDLLLLKFRDADQWAMSFCFCIFVCITLIMADGPQCTRLPIPTYCNVAVTILLMSVVTKDLPISPRFSPYDFLSRCKFSTLTTRQPINGWILLTTTRVLTLAIIKKLVFDKKESNSRLPHYYN